MPATSSERSLHARLAAYELHSKYDSRDLTAKARATFLARFEDEVDPDRELPEPERIRRAEAKRRAHFTRLALKSAQARRAKAGGAS